MWQETPEGPGRNDDFGDRNPERNDILQLDGGMRESEIVSVNAVRYDVDRFEAMPYDLMTEDIRGLLVYLYFW